jgi:uncharacterized membrane protein
MTLKQYQRIKLIVTVILAFVFSQAIVLKTYILPIALLIASSLLLLMLRRKVKEIVADERDYATAGKSALWAMQIYSWVAVIAMFIFYALEDINPAYEPIAITLAFSTCLLMLLYSIIFRYYNKFSLTDKKLIYIALAVVFFIIIAIAGLRLFSGEDDWICQDGKWIEHGHPDFPAPTRLCK